MLKFIARDTVNDVAIIQTSFCFNVRYGLQVTPCDTIEEAMNVYNESLGHALACKGLFDDEEN